jgi:hypothetical protein
MLNYCINTFLRLQSYALFSLYPNFALAFASAFASTFHNFSRHILHEWHEFNDSSLHEWHEFNDFSLHEWHEFNDFRKRKTRFFFARKTRIKRFSQAKDTILLCTNGTNLTILLCTKDTNITIFASERYDSSLHERHEYHDFRKRKTRFFFVRMARFSHFNKIVLSACRHRIIRVIRAKNRVIGLPILCHSCKKNRPVRLKIPSSNHAVADFLLCNPFSKFSVSHCCCNYGKCTTPFS